jgi:hypothetical protein
MSRRNASPPTARDLRDEARSFGHDGGCDHHKDCTALAVWMLAEYGGPACRCGGGCGCGQLACLAFYCADHVESAPPVLCHPG